MTNLDHDVPGPTALEKSRLAAKALSVTARKLRFSTSARSNLYKVVGLRPPLIEKLFRWGVLGATLLVLLLPNVLAGVYFGLIAADQYQSEARFVVRTSTPAIGKDQLGKVTGLPSAKIVQDTQIVTNFIHSRAILEALERDFKIKNKFASDKADFLARLEPDETYEEFLKYWNRMVKSSVSASSGIVTVTVNAFSAEDAQTILAGIIGASEQTINQLSDRIWKDVVTTAQTNLDRAQDKLSDVRQRMAVQQNETGVLTVEGSSAMLATLITTLQKEKMELDQSYAVKLESISKNAPQMKVLAREVESKQTQIDDLQRQIAGFQTLSGKNLADVSAKFSSLQFETKLAEEQFAASIRTFEQVQFISKQQLMYLDSFLAPTLPDGALYPKRAFWIGMIALGSVLAWAGSVGLLVLARNKFSG